MRDRIRKKSLSVVIVIGLCSGGRGGNVVAFVTSGSRSARETNISYSQKVWLSTVGTKRARPAGMIAATKTDGPKHTDDMSSAGKPKIKFDLLPDFMQKDPLLVTKQKWMERTMLTEIINDNSSSSNRKESEMMAMSALSVVFAVGIVYALASSTPEMITVDPNNLEESKNVARDVFREVNAEKLEIATRNIFGTVVPQSAEDVISVSIGEGIAGVIGAFATWLLGMIINFKSDADFILTPMNDAMKNSGVDSTRRYADSGRMGGRGNVDSLVSEAVADGDYFLTRAVAQPLLEALGIPVFFASFASVLIATLPYEAVKISSKKRRYEVKEQLLLQMLLEEEENRRRDMNVVDKVSNDIFDFIQQLNVRPPMDDIAEDKGKNVNYMTPRQIEQKGIVPVLDYVELFADVTKWLEYDVLISNYRGVLSLPNGEMLTTGWESAIFGFMAAFSSQLYTDVLYLYSDFGNPIKREMTLNRSLEGWASIYVTKCLSAATLFGVYEAVRGPTSRLLSQLVSGGVGGCVGSKDFDLCMETYLVDNPPGASLQAEFRASVVSMMNSLDSFSWLLPLNDQETLKSFFRGVAVSVYSELIRSFNG
ncbi:hypothetical protein ACHAXA_000072 [Cyclostephanos tholiformis]|uniref:Uncharacterized protein n=1 Tax=Cyclostephanos tholiformis TaxID=382380 RepID=A0ABD3SS35_9STRA